MTTKQTEQPRISGEPSDDCEYVVYHSGEEQRWYANAAGVQDNFHHYDVYEKFRGPGVYGPLSVEFA